MNVQPPTDGTSRPAKPTLDAFDLRILEELRENGRISVSALAQKVNLSRASAYNRVELLTRAGVITGFSARIDHRLVGLDICALVFVTVHPQMWESFRDALHSMPDVEYCSITTGEHDAMLLIRAVDVSGVHEFATGVVAIRPEVKAVVSVVVLDEVIRKPYLLPSDIPRRPQHAARLGMTRWTRPASDRESLPVR
ncbi:MAG: Lrp/AsnC family transcriptional regulator [Salinibacterium sp.]|nr:Lrp/AsnC family transcriptional regulator [Salinibacterium sp.]